MIRVAFWLLLALFTFAMSVEAAVDEPLRVAVSKDSYPYQYENAKGEPAGYLIDLWRRLAEQSGHQLEFRLMSWPETLKALEAGEVDFHAGIAHSPERATRFVLSEPLVTVPLKMFIHRDLPPTSRLQDLSPYRIGVVAGSVHEETLAREMRDPALVRYDTRDELLKAALAGEIQVFSNMDGYLRSSEQQSHISRMFPAHRRLALGDLPVSAAVLPANRAMVDRLNDGLNDLDAGACEILSRRWLGQSDIHSPLKVGVVSNMPPLMHVGEGGKADGFVVDLWRAWSRQTGVPVQFVPAGLGQTGLTALRYGELDLFAGHVAKEVGKLGLEKAYELYRVPTVLIQRAGQQRDLLATPEAALGLYANAGYESWLSHRYQHSARFSSDRPNDLITMLKEHKVDGVIMPAPLVPPLNSDFVSEVLNGPSVSLNVLVATGDQALSERVKRGFAELPPEQVLSLSQYWNQSGNTSLVGATSRPLIADPRSWLVSHSAIPSWAWQGLKLESALAELGQKLGVPLRSGTEPLAGQDPVTLSMELKGAPGPLEPPAQPLIEVEYLLLSEEALSSPLALSELTMPLAMMRGTPGLNWVREHHPQMAVREVRDRAEALAALEAGFALLLPSAQWKQWALPHLPLYQVMPLDPPRVGIYLMLPTANADWQPALNQAMTLLDWHASQITSTGDNSLPGKVRLLAWLSSVIIFVLAAGFIVIYRSWRWEQLQRRQLESQQNRGDGFDPVTGLPGRSMLDDRLHQAVLVHSREHRQVALLMLDLDGFSDINRRMGWEVGDQVLSEVANRWRSSLRRSDTLARMKADQFVVILNQVKSNASARHVAEMLMMELDQPVEVMGRTISISASIGVALYPQHGSDPVSLLQAADLQRRLVKGQGGGGYKVA
ncbi:GGDEF domain-containing protein [Marinobacter hydrocarbonoclasticus]|nr:GGDEF domain-containing protein [Marinobacter nauticus]